MGSFKSAQSPDPSDYTNSPADADVQEYANFLADEGPASLLRAALSAWLHGLKIHVDSTRWEQDVPMVSSAYEEWWCQSPDDAAAKLTLRLREILERRAQPSP